jgi:hypothetical protein
MPEAAADHAMPKLSINLGINKAIVREMSLSSLSQPPIKILVT